MLGRWRAWRDCTTSPSRSGTSIAAQRGTARCSGWSRSSAWRPLTALDAETEHRLFARYAAAASSLGASTGAITLLVSHRFSTVRMADLIVVVDGGRIVETGSHDDLMAVGGLYAELYELQALGYR